ncbi:MAG TPA: serine/threonine-protein kinase [Gemmataceae bacterium]|nr:serine/threonine-protein kinase [Gemmataceae bacterium]
MRDNDVLPVLRPSRVMQKVQLENSVFPPQIDNDMKTFKLFTSHQLKCPSFVLLAFLALGCLAWPAVHASASGPRGVAFPLAFFTQGGDADSGKPSEKSPVRKPPRRTSRPFDWTFGLGETTAYFIGGGIVLAIIILVVYKNQQGKEKGAPIVASDVIGGYRLQNLMMTGQTSQVWEVVETASNRHFAMKLLLPEKLQDPEHQRMLIHEAEVGTMLAHPNIIKIVKLVKDKHNPHFIMEFFPAGNLKLRVMHKKWDFIREKAHDIFKQAATALAYMHASGWVHRDVKPDNIMVNSAGEVRLIDFALAQPISKGGMFRRRKGRSAGTRSYMSPEQIRGQSLDARADIYSFGASMYEVITGRPPFRAASPTDLLNKHILEKPISPQTYNPDVTDECAALVLRMLAKKKQDRPKDFHEVLMQLRGIRVFKADKGPVAQKSTPA